jgi:hypothetical protein
MAVRPNRGGTDNLLWLAYWKVNSLRSIKLELDQSLSEHGVHICLINETQLVPGQDYRMSKYFCPRINCATQDGGTMILVSMRILYRWLPNSNGVLLTEAQLQLLILDSYI